MIFYLLQHHKYRYDSANKVIFARRNEIRIVTLAANTQPVYPVGTTKSLKQLAANPEFNGFKNDEPVKTHWQMI